MGKIIAIDPGQSGGIAVRYQTGVFSVDNMPDTPKDIFELLGIHDDAEICYLENVGGYMPGNSGPAAAKFAKHMGHLEMALLALEIPVVKVLPAKWEHWLIGKPNYPKIEKFVGPYQSQLILKIAPSDPYSGYVSAEGRKQILAKRKTERKNKIKMKVQELYPSLKITLKTADALGILHWGIKHEM